METPTPSDKSQFTRRRILRWTSVGAIGGLAGYFGWSDRGASLAPQVQKTSGTRVNSSEGQTTQSLPTAAAPAGPMSREAFLPHLGSAFQLDSGTYVTLLKVSAAEQTASSAATFVSFSLLFSMPLESSTEDRIYRVTHPEMAALELFISQVGRSKEFVHLEAVISQRV